MWFHLGGPQSYLCKATAVGWIPVLPPKLAGWTAVLALVVAFGGFAWRLVEYRDSRRRATVIRLYTELQGDAEAGFEDELVVIDVDNVGLTPVTVRGWTLTNSDKTYYPNRHEAGQNLHDVRIEPGSHARAEIYAPEIWQTLGDRRELRADVWLVGARKRHSNWMRPSRQATPVVLWRRVWVRTRRLVAHYMRRP